MLGAMALDDPEGKTIFQSANEYANGDPNIHLLTNIGGSAEVNAFQRQASVILQKSVREGFGLTVTEGLWKERPVVANKVGGIPLQIEDGVTGYLVTNTEQCVERVLTILQHPDAAISLADVVARLYGATSSRRQTFATIFDCFMTSPETPRPRWHNSIVSLCSAARATAPSRGGWPAEPSGVNNHPSNGLRPMGAISPCGAAAQVHPVSPVPRRGRVGSSGSSPR